jgi:CHAT domain-containing protein
MSELPFALREITVAEDFLTNVDMDELKPRPFHDDVLLCLDSCDIFHFAGHGRFSLEPMEGSLVLKDRPLTVANLVRPVFEERKPFLAYLSACGTGRIEIKNEDQDIHLISAFQLAGFQNVIGTMWSVRHEVCLQMATLTYGRIQAKGPSDRSVSEALHFALRTLRNECIANYTVAREEALGRVESEVSTGSGQSRDGRDIVSCDDDDLPLDWIPFVHYGL